MRAATMPLVSVLIPAFNAQQTIAESLRSAQRQTYADLEIIVVDDGSTDDTPKIVSRFGEQDPRIVLIRQANAGVAVARNTALANSEGSLIAPLDADDLWHPQKIERQVANLHHAPDDVGLDYCWFVDIDVDSVVTRCYANRLEGDVYHPLILDNFIGNSSVPLIRRALLEQIGGWEPGLRAANAQGCEDWLLYLQIAERARVVLSPAFLVGYRQLPQAMSRNVHQMTRSYEMTMSYARARRPDIPQELFARSRRDFDRYISGMCKDATHRTTTIRHVLASISRRSLNGPHNFSLLRELARRLRRTPHAASHLGIGAGAGAHGYPFSAIEADLRCPICDPGD
ncbi:glycosyltransferase family A protein [Bradyrhizobium sp. CCGUVB23]|uniref:glycosyltransferase family 2 protein n=1 Tax=Bradyrhizobium sp. CCGUVB23 TaxID=2949630 RepID=UPI0020B1FB96|nr:glycosyltransferase family A protein [Bradyrhizobium sp. CCGUVB23]MCP3460044.1 glycosyltransferase family 2 protein [Bradyrhizobium sp. CCGUVB23]